MLPKATMHPSAMQVLPADLADALQQAALATAEAIQRSNARCQVGVGMELILIWPRHQWQHKGVAENDVAASIPFLVPELCDQEGSREV
jgi:hypothetical protein